MVSDAHDAGQLGSDAVQTATEPEKRDTSNVIRTRVIPILAGSMVVGLLAILAYALFAPASARVDPGQTVTDLGAIVYDDPKPAPNFELQNFDGSTFRLSDYRGQIVVLNFWASWCKPCIEEMPMLNQASMEMADSDVVVVGVSVWDEREQAEKFAKSLNVTYPLLEDDPATSIAVEYGLTGVPETYVITANGEISSFFRGQFTNLQQLRDMVAMAR